MRNESRQIYVYEHWTAEAPVLLGCLLVDNVRGAEHFSFEYDDVFLGALRSSFALDPELRFYHGRQYPDTKPIFGVFADSSPDRWGRMLLSRREQLAAIKEGRKPKKLK